ncbi:MAG: hypothetical protein ACXADX_05345, partial [Candidatus Hodarchaeales archaeon]
MTVFESPSIPLRIRLKGYVGRQWRGWREEMDPMSSIFILCVVIFFFVFLIYPLLYISYTAFIVDGQPSLARFFGEDYSVFTAADRAY